MNRENSLADHRRPWPFLLLGHLLIWGGLGLYIVQVVARHLWTPWYVPALATLGVVCFGAAWRARRSWPRFVTVIFGLLFCAAQWYMLALGTRTPDYAGPIISGQPVPAFVATGADGHAFEPNMLSDGKNSIVVFFRGRW